MDSLTITLTVDGADADDAQQVFEDTVRAFRTIGGTVTGDLSVTGGSTVEDASTVADDGHEDA